MTACVNDSTEVVMKTGSMFLAALAAVSTFGCALSSKLVSWPGAGGDDRGAVASAAPVATASSVAGGRPSWCDVDGAHELESRSVDDTLTDDDVRDQVFELTGHFCSEDPASERRDELAGLFARISSELSRTEADWGGAV